MLRLLRALLVLSTLTLGLVACGDDEKKDSAAAYKPLTTKNFATAITKAMTAQETYVMTMEGPGMSMDIEARIDPQGALAMQGTVTEDGESIELIFLDGRTLSREEGDKKYTELPPAFAAAMAQGLGDMSPAGQIKDFEEVLGSVEYLGPEKDGDEQRYAYQVNLDPAAAKKRLEKDAGQKVDKLPEEFPLSIRLVLDGDHLIREMKVEADGEKIVIKSDRWGEPVDIKIPPKSQIEQLDLS